MISVFFSFIFKHTRMTVTMEHTDEVNQHLSETFHLVLSCLIFSFVVSSLSVFFLCLCLRVLVVCVCVCVVVHGCVCVCVVVYGCVCVWCCVLWCGVWCVVWHAEKTRVYIQKRLRVYIRNVPVYAGNTRACFSAKK